MAVSLNSRLERNQEEEEGYPFRGALSAEPSGPWLVFGVWGLVFGVWCLEEAWSFYITISGVRLCWELEEPKGPKGVLKDQVVLIDVPAPPVRASIQGLGFGVQAAGCRV